MREEWNELGTVLLLWNTDIVVQQGREHHNEEAIFFQDSDVVNHAELQNNITSSLRRDLSRFRVTMFLEGINQ